MEKNKESRKGEKDILEPLSIALVWNTQDQEIVSEYIEYTKKMLSSDPNNLFSRTLDLPVFYYTNSTPNDIPPKVKLTTEKAVIYLFASVNCAANEKWTKYVDEMLSLDNVNVVPIALDKHSFNLSDRIAAKNFIRAYEFKSCVEQQLFIWMAHEIYRYGFNEKKDMSRENSLNIFLSHAKDGEHGIKLAEKLKALIENTTLSRFFDASDIAPGYRFDDEICNSIKCSSIIVINSDIYSTRYWCQREVQTAKEFERPMLEVDLIDKGMDRKFPYAGNVPVIRVNLVEGETQDEDLYRILERVLLETIRFNYVKMKLASLQKNIIGRNKIMCRPPEMIDLQKIINKGTKGIFLEYDNIIYPDPPIYSEEINFYDKLGINVFTPIEYKKDLLLEKRVGISISDVEQDELQRYGLTKEHLSKLSKTIAKYILGKGGILVYGGDLRKDGFTEQLIMEAHILKDRLKSDSIYLENYISWPIYNNNSNQINELKADHRKLLKIVEVDIDEKAKEYVEDSGKFVPPNTVENCYAWAKSLTKMRNCMIKNCDARICAGGRKIGYKGKMPGVLEEILIASELGCPIYLLGGFGGIVKAICNLIQYGEDFDCLSEQWQIEHNNDYLLLLEQYEKNGEKINYAEILEKIKNIKLNNGLSEDENRILFSTVYIDEATQIILSGLQRI